MNLVSPEYLASHNLLWCPALRPGQGLLVALAGLSVLESLFALKVREGLGVQLCLLSRGSRCHLLFLSLQSTPLDLVFQWCLVPPSGLGFRVNL